MEAIEHRFVQVNGINMHVAEMGPVNGPVILFLHGFPELWYSWRHQIVALASKGYRAVAPDLRGYGDTDAPADPQTYTVLHIVGDIIGLLDAVAAHQEKVFIVGHDWGAYVAWFLCLFRPDRVKALVNLSVQFLPRNPHIQFIDMVRSMYGDDYYMCRFQEVGHVEAACKELGAADSLKEFMTLFSQPRPLLIPKGESLIRRPENPAVLPPWLSEEDLKYCSTKFEKTGFTGGLNYYRNLDRSWELTAPWTGAKVTVPAKFITGDKDIVYNSYDSKNYIEKGQFKKDVPLLEEVVILEGAHFINQVKPDEINKHIADFFQKF